MPGLWKKRTHSYTRSSEMLTIHILPFDFCTHLLLVFRKISQSIHWIPREQAKPRKISQRKICACTGIHRKSGAFSIPIPKNRVNHVVFAEKKGLIIYLAVWKGGPFGTHIRTMPYIGSYPPPPPHQEVRKKKKMQVKSYALIIIV